MTECIRPPPATSAFPVLYINEKACKCGPGILFPAQVHQLFTPSRHCCKPHDFIVSSPAWVRGRVASQTLHIPLPFFRQILIGILFRTECESQSENVLNPAVWGIPPHGVYSMTSLRTSAPFAEMYFFGNPAQKYSQNLCAKVPVAGFNKRFGFSLGAKTSTVWLRSVSSS